MKRPENSRGFTLIEAIVAVILMGIISGLIATVIATTIDTLADVRDRARIVTSGASAIAFFEREVRMMGADTALLIADDDQLRFNDRWGNTIEYTISSGKLYRQIVGVGSAQVQATPIVTANCSFLYYKIDNSELSSIPLGSSDRQDTRLIELRLVLDDGQSGIPYLVRVFPENLKVVRS